MGIKQVSKIKNVIEYILIIALYYITGGVFSYTNYSLQITVFFIISFLLCFFYKKYDFLRQKPFSILFYMSLFTLIVPLIFYDSISTYIAIIMQLAIGMFCSSFIPFKEFIRKYINVIVFFALISLICFVIGILKPSIATVFPMTIGDASVDYYNAGVYVFMSAKGYGAGILSISMRNAGICWEPGCYQCFLNIGLLFLLEREKNNHQKHFYFKFFVLILTVMTTVSTTGIIILIVLLIVYFKEWSKNLGRSIFLIPLIIISALVFYNKTELGTMMQNKIGKEFGVDKGFMDRISLSKINYIISDNGFFYLFGMSFSKWIEINETLWNSIIHSFLCLGIPFTIIHLIGYWKGSHLLSKNGWLLFLIMIMCASTETLFWRVFFNTFAFYGWTYYKNKKIGDI